MDALPHWPHAVAVLGKPSEAHLGLLAAAKRPVVMCLDADAWRTGVGVMQRLRLRGVEAHYLELPPGRDPGEMTTEDLLSRAHELCAK